MAGQSMERERRRGGDLPAAAHIGERRAACASGVGTGENIRLSHGTYVPMLPHF